jgi:hypothetical protein
MSSNPPTPVHVQHLQHGGPKTQPSAHHHEAHAQHLAKRQGQSPAATPAQPVTAPLRAAQETDLDDEKIAAAIFEFELQILSFWFMALTSFDKVLTSSTRAAAAPHFAEAVFDMFEEKVLGEFAKATKADLVIDAFKAIIKEGDRAKAALTSVNLRDFYTSHVKAIAAAESELTQEKELFVQTVKDRSEQLLRNDPDEYGMFRMGLLEHYQEADARLKTATQEELFSGLSTEWIRQYQDADIKLQIWEDDLSVYGVHIDAPDGEQIAEELQQAGVNFWHMKVTRVYAFYERGGNGWPSGYVRVDANNRLINIPAEQTGDYRKVYERLGSQ